MCTSHHNSRNKNDRTFYSFWLLNINRKCNKQASGSSFWGGGTRKSYLLKFIIHLPSFAFSLSLSLLNASLSLPLQEDQFDQYFFFFFLHLQASDSSSSSSPCVYICVLIQIFKQRLILLKFNLLERLIELIIALTAVTHYTTAEKILLCFAIHSFAFYSFHFPSLT